MANLIVCCFRARKSIDCLLDGNDVGGQLRNNALQDRIIDGNRVVSDLDGIVGNNVSSVRLVSASLICEEIGLYIHVEIQVEEALSCGEDYAGSTNTGLLSC